MDTLQGIFSFGMRIAQTPAQLQSELDQLKAKLPSARLLICRSEWGMFRNKELDELFLQLKYATYDAEDLLRGFEDQALQHRIEGAGRSRRGLFISFSLKNATHFLLHASSKRIRETQDKLDNAMAMVEKELNLMGLHVEPVNAMPTTTEIITAPQVFGRDTERDQVMEMLGVTATIDRTDEINQVITQMGVSSSKRKSPAAAAHGTLASTHKSVKRLQGNSSSSAGLAEATNNLTGDVSVLPIFGIGGIGKTTLAQLIYHNERVKAHFARRIWVCVSDLFDDERMIKEIFRTIAGPHADMPSNNIQDIRKELKEQLKRQNFLLVLDDMWEIGQLKWEYFFAPLRHGLEGSMILVTTRDKNFAHLVATSNCEPVQLKGLPADIFWEFFKNCAFDKERPESYPHLQDIGRSICSKLCGTPLAAKTLGRLLSSNLTEEHWTAINDSELWEQEQKEGDILPALRLSYLHLPFELRRCFAFCSMFPKDYSLERDKIVDIWVAEGFVAPQGTKQLEDVGISYFDKLRGRYLFQTDPKFPNQNKYVMHDLIHDTAQQASMHECFLMKDFNKVIHKLRHMSVEVDAKSLSTMADIQFLNNLRSLRFSTRLDAEITWFSQLSNILFLSLKYYALEELPKSICELRSLRYLDISHSNVREFPPKFWCLYSLQVLDASCSGLRTINEDITKLINLRQLALPRDASMALLSLRGLGNLSCLRNLSCFIVGREDGGIRKLKGMNQLRGALCIRSIFTVKSKEEAAAARLVEKKYLKKLDLYWRDGYSHGMPDPSENEVADCLCPNKRIECLKVNGFGGDRLPSWMNPNYLNNLRSLELSGCSSLKSLSISHFTGGVQGGSTGQHASSSNSCGNGMTSLVAFTHLTSISIVGCRGLENLDQFLSPKNLPSVQSITIEGCPMLKSIPVGNFVGFVHLQDLNLQNCPSLVCPQPSEQMDLPPSIQRLCIAFCGQLDKSFPPSWLDKLTSLTVLCLMGCRNIVSITCTNKLIYLDLQDCRELSSIGGSPSYTNFSSCPKLTQVVQQRSRNNALQREELDEILKFVHPR